MAEETSAGAALKMYKKGFTDISALKGGLYGWEKAGYPVVKK